MSNLLMARPEQKGVPTHLVRELNERKTLVKKDKYIQKKHEQI